ncbi:hypothetical protein DL766_003310 [Monosporascus sp. MC13-8B]|uniref:Inner membrane component domain-containing protein n=1 Tax=Monosporascus cannonballus TaxID=155416 RepID=A0ABY0H840_9PEZI|nr:hypothetical protein DL763_006531 [Monosporascus cannonballus]RYO87282.1 hypothetical protein DL762_004327 [Monosporascus cannonballus]RYP33721.1 hypothetical protein DL766_003310 [Monosporascus sp. MC13-8B]
MAIPEPIERRLVQPEYSEVDDTTCPPYDNSSSQQSPLLRNPEDFDIEAQQPPRYHPDLGDGQGKAAAESTEAMRLQEPAAGTRPRCAAEALRPDRRYMGPVLVVIRKLCHLALYLLFGALGLIVAFTLLIGIGIVLTKLAMVASWICEKIGLL